VARRRLKTLGAAGFDVTPGFNPDRKNRDPGCKFPPPKKKLQPGSSIQRLNPLSESDPDTRNFTNLTLP